MFGLGFGEILVILLIALIFIGPKKLPELARGLGKGLREFQNATKGLAEQIDQAKSEIHHTQQEITDAVQLEESGAQQVEAVADAPGRADETSKHSS